MDDDGEIGRDTGRYLCEGRTGKRLDGYFGVSNENRLAWIDVGYWEEKGNQGRCDRVTVSRRAPTCLLS